MTQTLLDRRLPLVCPALLLVDGKSLPATLRDVSQSGFLVCTELGYEELLVPGTQLVVRCELPRTPGTVSFATSVVWARPGSDHRGGDAWQMGLRIGEVDEATRGTLDQFVLGFFETVLIADGDQATRTQVRRVLGAQYDVIEASSGADVLRLLDRNEVAVLILAEQLPDGDAKLVLREAQSRFPGMHAVRMVISTTDAAQLEELSRLHRVFYFLRRPLQSKELTDVVRSAVARFWEAARREPDSELDVRSAAFSRRMLDATRRISMQRDLATAGRLATDAVIDLVECDRASYYIYDAISETLWSGGDDQAASTRSAIAGVSGYVARTGSAVTLARIEMDPRFQRSIDDPESQGSERLACLPIMSADKRTLGVLLAIRNANRPAFSPVDQERFALLAANVSPAFSQMALQTQIEQVFATESRRTDEISVFRRQAVEANRAAGTTLNRPLALSPRWVGRAYRLLVTASLATALFIVLGTMGEYAAGPALVRIEGRTDLTATEPSIVASVEVQPGQRVVPGQVLVKLHDAKETLDLERISREFELQLVKSLRTPGDASIRENLAKLRTERDFAQGRVESRAIHATQPGVVNDVRIRPGQSLGPGDPLLSITGEGAEPSIVAMLPGQYRPMLKVGQPIRLEVSGFRYAYAELAVESIGDEVVGPQEVQRYLGKEVGDSVKLDGPVVLVRARLPSRSFLSDGKLYNYHDGMQGQAEVRLRAQRIIVRLVPALKAIAWIGGDVVDEREAQ